GHARGACFRDARRGGRERGAGLLGGIDQLGDERVVELLPPTREVARLAVVRQRRLPLRRGFGARRPLARRRAGTRGEQRGARAGGEGNEAHQQSFLRARKAAKAGHSSSRIKRWFEVPARSGDTAGEGAEGASGGQI